MRDGRVVERIGREAGPRRWPSPGAAEPCSSSSAWSSRELRAAWRRLLFFFLCVAIGVGAIAALRSVIQNVRGGAGPRGARADRRRRRLLDQSSVAGRRSRARSIAAISKAPVPAARGARRDGDDGAAGGHAEAVARMVELQAVDARLSVLRTLVLEAARRIAHDMLRRPRRARAAGTAGAAGDRRRRPVRIGDETFTIRGVIEREPGRRAGLFTSRPARASSTRRDLDAHGSARRSAAARAISDPGARRRRGHRRRLSSDLRARSSGSFVTARSYRSTRRPRRRGAAGRGELSRPGRLRDGRARRHRRLERDARLHPAEAAQHRRAEVPRRDGRQMLGVYIAQVLLLGLLGSLLGLGARRGGAAVPSPADCSALDKLECAPDATPPPAGRRHRRPGVAAVRARAAARSAPRATAAGCCATKSARASLGGAVAARSTGVQWATAA